MTQFQFITACISIVLALGVSDMLSSRVGASMISV